MTSELNELKERINNLERIIWNLLSLEQIKEALDDKKFNDVISNIDEFFVRTEDPRDVIPQFVVHNRIGGDLNYLDRCLKNVNINDCLGPYNLPGYSGIKIKQ